MSLGGQDLRLLLEPTNRVAIQTFWKANVSFKTSSVHLNQTKTTTARWPANGDFVHISLDLSFLFKPNLLVGR